MREISYSGKIKELRRVMTVSQSELVDILQVSFATVNRWENGYFNPTIKTLRKLKKLFKEYGLKENE